MRESVLRWAASERGQEVRRAIGRKWRETPRGRQVGRRNSRRQREREYGIESALPVGYDELVYEVFGRRCAWCQGDRFLVLDHHRPLVDGNALLHNAVPLCRSCNCHKKNRPPEQFYGPLQLSWIEECLAEVRRRFESQFGQPGGGS